MGYICEYGVSVRVYICEGLHPYYISNVNTPAYNFGPRYSLDGRVFQFYQV